MRKLSYIFLLFSLVILFSQAVSPASESKAKILVLYKERDPGHEGIISILTPLLKQAGYDFDTRDVEELLVKKPDMDSYSGIMTCYQTSQMVGGDVYPYWLVEQMEAGRRILIIGSYGAYQGMIKKPDGTFIEWNESTQTINTFFHPFGLEFHFAFTSDNQKLKLVTADKEYGQFQAPITQKDLQYYQLYTSVNQKNKIFFELERTDMIASRSALNVMTPFGGMVLEGYSYFWDAGKNKTIFRVNFPGFIKEVFSAKSPPVPKFKIKTHAELVKRYPLPERTLPQPQIRLQSSELSRRVLVLYKKSEVRSLEELPFYNRAAVVLEYLGMIPVYRAVEDGLPDDDFMDNFHGIITWHTKPHMHEAEKYGNWLLQQINRGKRVAILEDYGASYDLATQEPAVNQAKVMKALGIKFVKRKDKREEYLPEVRFVDKEMLSFERKFDPSTVTYVNSYTSIDDRNRVFLSFSDREFGVVDLGIITQNGGICLEQTAFYFPTRDAERISIIHEALKGEIAPEIAEQETLGAWYLNPYRFFAEALGLDKFPTPDITTLNGSRIFYAHIDGDALESISLIDGAHFAGFIVYEEILKKYTDIPTSVSVITKFIERIGNQYHRPVVELARKIFRLPNVDIAVHAATHPFDWVGGDPYIVNPDSYPYEIGYKPHDLIEEIWGAKLFAGHNLVPPNKEVETLFWSGATNPDKNALEIAWRAGLHNLNGGDPRYDDEYPSLAGVCSYSLPYEPYRQYLTSAQNDYIYSLFLTGDWGGQKKVLKHYARTDKPYRFYPMNMYYHFYGGIKNESMDAIRYIYDYVRSIDAAAIFATRYCEIVEDYYNTHVGFDGQSYWVENDGFLRTLRFNYKTHVDMERSRGVIGYNYHNDQTYIHLDGSRRRKIVLSDSQPKLPYFVQATQFIDRSEFDGSQLNFSCRGFGKMLLRIGGLGPNAEYQLTLESSDRETIQASIKTNQDGILEYRTQLDAPVTVYKGVLK
ncbi:MAG: hypothetical protein GY777_28620 [Candidatus Brocadiaceae bacterium]|nr:hypothetical protein [Candidatus Brocadiaceae bacterium]